MLSDATEIEQGEGAQKGAEGKVGDRRRQCGKKKAEQRTRETNRTAAGSRGWTGGRGETSAMAGPCCVCVFLVLACLHMLWATARLGSARAAAAAVAAAAVSNLCAIETYEMQKCSPENSNNNK